MKTDAIKEATQTDARPERLSTSVAGVQKLIS
jgi:hypothetical protein